MNKTSATFNISKKIMFMALFYHFFGPPSPPSVSTRRNLDLGAGELETRTRRSPLIVFEFIVSLFNLSGRLKENDVVDIKPLIGN